MANDNEPGRQGNTDATSMPDPSLPDGNLTSREVVQGLGGGWFVLGTKFRGLPYQLLSSMYGGGKGVTSS